MAKEQDYEDDYLFLVRKFRTMSLEWGTPWKSLRLFVQIAKWMEPRHIEKTVLIYQNMLSWIDTIDTVHDQDQILRDAASFFVRHER
jgi:hypothetical protein